MAVSKGLNAGLAHRPAVDRTLLELIRRTTETTALNRLGAAFWERCCGIVTSVRGTFINSAGNPAEHGKQRLYGVTTWLGPGRINFSAGDHGGSAGMPNGAPGTEPNASYCERKQRRFSAIGGNGSLRRCRQTPAWVARSGFCPETWFTGVRRHIGHLSAWIWFEEAFHDLARAIGFGHPA